MSKYADYDKLLLTLIDGGCSDFDSICRRTTKENAQLCGDRDPWRVPDMRLQALRKAGKIAFDRSRRIWHRATPE